MKKSILFGALAIFAISALSIQNVNAQTPEKKADSKSVEQVTEKSKTPAVTTVGQEPVQKKGDCCQGKKACADKKKGGDCCADKKVGTDEKSVKSEGKVIKAEGKNNKHDAVKPKEIKNKSAVKSEKGEK